VDGVELPSVQAVGRACMFVPETPNIFCFPMEGTSRSDEESPVLHYQWARKSLVQGRQLVGGRIEYDALAINTAPSKPCSCL
jgi:hypothetical protein